MSEPIVNDINITEWIWNMNELLFKNSRTRHFPMKNYEYLGLRLDEQVIVFVLVNSDEVLYGFGLCS